MENFTRFLKGEGFIKPGSFLKYFETLEEEDKTRYLKVIESLSVRGWNHEIN